MRRARTHLTACLLGIVTLTLPVKGFGPLAHHAAAPIPSVEWFSNLPDLWSSRAVHPSEDPRATFSYDVTVAEDFAWSHACQKKGQLSPVNFTIPLVIPISVSVTAPEEPTSYGQPQGIEKAEWDMWNLCQNKLESRPGMYLMEETARGFLCHNSEDSVVHFTYFLGNSAWGWVVEHYIKESWAEYDVFWAQGGRFDYSGFPIIPSSITMGAAGDPDIINLAQKVSRKNRQNFAFDGYPPAERTTQTAGDISALIADQSTKLSTYLQGFHQLKMDAYNAFGHLPATYSSLGTLLTPATNWNQGDGWFKCLEAKAAAQLAYASMQ